MNTLLRKLLASASVVALLSGLMVSTASAATFKDVSADDMWYDAVEQTVADGIFSKADNFNSFGTVNRAMMAVIAVKAGGFEMMDAGTTAPFPDVPADHWAADAIYTGVKNGLFKGYDSGLFGPGDSLTRGQAAIILMNTFAFDATQECGATFPDVPSSHYAADAISQAWCWSWINGYDNGKFGPNDSLLRYQIAIMVNNAKHNAVWREWTGTTPPPVMGGSLTITEGENMPEGGTVPKGATNVNFLSFALTAGDEEASVDGMTFGRQGVGSTQDLSSVYLYEGNNRLTTGRTVSSDENTVEFSSLGWTIAPGETRTFEVRVDMATDATASDQHRLYIYSIEGADEVGGEVNLAGPYYTVGGQSAASVTVEKTGSLTNPTLGQQGAKIGQFKVTPDGEDVTVKWINVYVTGTISANEIDNFKLYQGTVISDEFLVGETDAISDRDTAAFDLGDGIQIEDGKQETFVVTADLHGDADDTVETYIDENSDVYAEGDVYGTGTTVDKTAYDSTTSHIVTLQGGEVTIDFNGPKAGDVSVDQQKVSFLDFSISAERDIEVKSLSVTVTDTSCDVTDDDNDLVRGAGTEANFKNIRVMEGDKNMMETESFTTTSPSTDDANDDCDQLLTFTDSFYVDGGETKDLSVKMDVDNNASADDTIQVTLGAISSTGIKDVSTNKYIDTDNIVPSSAIVGNVQTLVASSLTISHASTPVADTFVKGTKNVPVVGFLFKTGTAEAVKVTSVTLTGYIDEDGTTTGLSATGTNNSVSLKDVINSIRLYEDGYAADKDPVADSASVETDGSVVFDNMNYDIAKSSTKKLVVVGDVSANAYVNSDAETVAFDIATAASDVVAEDEDGDDISSSITGDASNGGASPTAYILTGDAGTLTVASKSSQAAANIVIAGRDGVELGRFEFAATTEDINVEDITLSYGSSSTGGADEVSEVFVYDADDLTTPLGSGFVQNGTVDINSIGLLVPADEKAVLVVAADLNTLPAGADSGSAIAVGLKSVDKAQGQAGTNVSVTEDTDLTCSVTITLTSAGDTEAALGGACSEVSVGDVLLIVDGVTSNEYVLVLDKDANDDGTETDYTVARAVGGASSTAVVHTAINLATSTSSKLAARGNYMVVRETKPTFATVAYPTGTKLENGSSKGVYKFTVDAEAEEDVDLNTIVFKVTGQFAGDVLGDDQDVADDADDPSTVNGSATDGSDGLARWTSDGAAPAVVVTGVTVYDVTDGEDVDNVTVTYTNDDTSTGYITVVFGDSEEVSSSGRTYELRADVSGVGTSGDFLSVLIDDQASTYKELETDTASNVNDNDITIAGGITIYTNVIWSDESSTAHTTSTSDYTNAYLLKSLKTVAQTMTFTTS